jgi:hypothetical protein
VSPFSAAAVAAAAGGGGAGDIDTVDAIKFPSDQSVRLFYIDLKRDRIVAKEPAIDFKTAVPAKGSSNCHGLAFNYIK